MEGQFVRAFRRKSVAGVPPADLPYPPGTRAGPHTPRPGWRPRIPGDPHMARRNPATRTVLQLLALEDRATPDAGNALTPVASDDFSDTDGNNPVIIDELANDAGVGGKTLDRSSLAIVTQPTHGTVE